MQARKSKQIIPRAHQRFKAKEGTFAVLLHDSSRFGHLIDISPGGFSFCFSDSPFMDNQHTHSGRDGQALLYSGEPDLFEGLSEFDLFLVDSSVYLERIPCKIVSEFELNEDNESISVAVKRCCLKFKGLAPKQISELADFIEQYTEGPA